MVYLDNAATSYPKPDNVISAVTKCMTDCGGNPGRSAHPLAMAAAETIFRCREALADFFGAPDAGCVAFTSNCTEALNIAVKGAIPHGGHVLTSDLEHNSVRRPLERLKREGTADYSVFHILYRGRPRPYRYILNDMERLLRRETCAVVITAAPNTCSVNIPLKEISDFCARHGLKLIVDGAQAAGHKPLNITSLGIHALCIPGHKGLMGPQGCGALILNKGFLPAPLKDGGSGAASSEPLMPREPPERYEAGTLPTPAIAGLMAGLEAVKAIGTERIERTEASLFAECRTILQKIPGIVIYAPDSPGSVLSFNLSGFSSDITAQALARRGICVRSGLHCAPWAHEALGTAPGGTVRVSFSWQNTGSDLLSLYSAMNEVRNEFLHSR